MSRQLFECGVVVVHPNPDLLEVITAAHAAGGFTSGLYGWEQQPDEDADDGDHNEQLHERECVSGAIERMIHAWVPEKDVEIETVAFGFRWAGGQRKSSARMQFRDRRPWAP